MFTLYMRHEYPVTISPFLPSNSTICPRNGPKMATNGPDCALFVSNNPKTNNGPYLGLRGSKPDFRGHLVQPRPPVFVVSKPQNHPTRRLDSRIGGQLVDETETRAAHSGGQRWVHRGPRGGKNHFFPKDHL